MSKIGDVLTGSLGALGVGVGSQLISALFLAGRSIGGIIPDVTIEEVHTDTLTISDHPVEQGANITDHAVKNPAELTMRVAWGNSKSAVNSIVSGSIFSGKISNVNDLYAQILDLQAARTLFSVVTGKRTYDNMLFKSVSVTTDRESENSLVLVAMMRQVIIVQTADTSLVALGDQSFPMDTGATVNSGTKQPVTAKAQSALRQLFGG